MEELVAGLRDLVGEPFKLPVYIIDCGKLADICVKEPFKVNPLFPLAPSTQLLPLPIRAIPSPSGIQPTNRSRHSSSVYTSPYPPL